MDLKKNGLFTKDNVTNNQEWESLFNKVYHELGVANSPNLGNYLLHVYLDCNAGVS